MDMFVSVIDWMGLRAGCEQPPSSPTPKTKTEFWYTPNKVICSNPGNSPTHKYEWCTLALPRCRTKSYSNSFFPRTASLWNSLPGACFSASYNLDCFKRNINSYLQLPWVIFIFNVFFLLVAPYQEWLLALFWAILHKKKINFNLCIVNRLVVLLCGWLQVYTIHAARNQRKSRSGHQTKSYILKGNMTLLIDISR